MESGRDSGLRKGFLLQIQDLQFWGEDDIVFPICDKFQELPFE